MESILSLRLGPYGLTVRTDGKATITANGHVIGQVTLPFSVFVAILVATKGQDGTGLLRIAVEEIGRLLDRIVRRGDDKRTMADVITQVTGIPLTCEELPEARPLRLSRSKAARVVAFDLDNGRVYLAPDAARAEALRRMLGLQLGANRHNLVRAGIYMRRPAGAGFRMEIAGRPVRQALADGHIAIVDGMAMALQGTFLAKDGEGLTLAKGLVRGRLRVPVYRVRDGKLALVGELEEPPAFIEDAPGFGKLLRRGLRGVFYPKGPAKHQRPSVSLQAAIFSLTPDSIKAWLEGVTPVRGRIKSLMRNGLPGAQIQSFREPKKWLGRKVPGVRAIALALVTGEEVWPIQHGWVYLLPETKAAICKRLGRNLKYGEPLAICREPALPNGSAVQVFRFAGTAKYIADPAVGTGVVFRPDDPAYAAMGGDFDGDYVTVWPVAATPDLEWQCVVETPATLKTGAKLPAGELSAELLDELRNVPHDQIGLVVWTAAQYWELGRLDEQAVKDFCLLIQSSIDSKKHAVDAATWRALFEKRALARGEGAQNVMRALSSISRAIEEAREKARAEGDRMPLGIEPEYIRAVEAAVPGRPETALIKEAALRYMREGRELGMGLNKETVPGVLADAAAEIALEEDRKRAAEIIRQYLAATRRRDWRLRDAIADYVRAATAHGLLCPYALLAERPPVRLAAELPERALREVSRRVASVEVQAYADATINVGDPVTDELVAMIVPRMRHLAMAMQPDGRVTEVRPYRTRRGDERLLVTITREPRGGDPWRPDPLPEDLRQLLLTVPMPWEAQEERPADGAPPAGREHTAAPAWPQPKPRLRPSGFLPEGFPRVKAGDLVAVFNATTSAEEAARMSAILGANGVEVWSHDPVVTSSAVAYGGRAARSLNWERATVLVLVDEDWTWDVLKERLEDVPEWNLLGRLKKRPRRFFVDVAAIDGTPPPPNQLWLFDEPQLEQLPPHKERGLLTVRPDNGRTVVVLPGYKHKAREYDFQPLPQKAGAIQAAFQRQGGRPLPAFVYESGEVHVAGRLIGRVKSSRDPRWVPATPPYGAVAAPPRGARRIAVRQCFWSAETIERAREVARKLAVRRDVVVLTDGTDPAFCGGIDPARIYIYASPGEAPAYPGRVASHKAASMLRDADCLVYIVGTGHDPVLKKARKLGIPTFDVMDPEQFQMLEAWLESASSNRSGAEAPRSEQTDNRPAQAPAGHKDKEDMKRIIIYTDGACSGNPGPGGWAAILRYNQHEKVLQGAEARTTNNRMELTAVIEALRALKEPCRVDVYTDSNYIVGAFQEGWVERWQRNGWRTASKKPVENQDLWRALLELTRRHDVRFLKVKGHADDALNNRVDRLAVEAMRRGMASGRHDTDGGVPSGPPPQSPTPRIGSGQLRVAVSGHRDASKELQALARAVGQRLVGRWGAVLHSGGARGADAAFCGGVDPAKVRIYAPWPGYRPAHHGRVVQERPSGEDYRVAELCHPAWNRCSSAAKALLARNVSLLRGADVLVCLMTRESSGTGHAVRVAQTMGIPVFNIADPRQIEALGAWLRARLPAENIEGGGGGSG